MTSPEQFDILGQPLEVGNYVAVSRRNEMSICQVCKITPKMIRARIVNKKYHSDDTGILIYSSNTVKLSGEDAVAYVLKYSG